MDGFDAGSVRVSLGFDLDDRQLKVYDREYQQAKAKSDIRTGVRFDYDQKAYREFMRAHGELERLRPIHLEVKVDVDNSKLAGFRSDLKSAERDTQSFGNVAGQAFGIVGTALSDVNTKFALIVGFSPAILALGGAVTALAGSLGAAVAGAGALGVGLGGALAPVIALAGSAMSRLSDITKVYQAQQQATVADQTKAQNAHQKTTQAVSGLASAMDSLKNAQVGVIDARHGLTQAERDYATAVSAAQTKINSTRDAEVKAARDVADAQRKLAQARVDAQRAQEDQQRAAEDAALSQADAITQRDQLAASGQSGTRAYFDAQRAVEAATTSAARAQQDNQAYLEQGARAFQPLDDALRNLADTTKTYHARQHDLIVVERQGIDQAPGVVAAVDRIRTARESLTRAVRAQHAAERGVSSAQTTTAAPMGFDTGQAKANALFGALDAVDKHLLATGKHIIDSFEEATKGGVDAIFTGLDNGLRRVPGMLAKLTPDLTRLGQTIGGVLDNFLANLTSPTWTRAWQTFTQAAQPIVQDFGRGFTDIANILRDIALAVLPDLKSILGDVADGMDTFAGKVHKALGDGSLQKTVHGLVQSFKDWANLVGQVSLLLISIFQGGKSTGDNMVVNLTNIVKKWREWIDANPEKVHKFFKDAKDLLKHIADVIVPVAKGFISIIEKAMEFFSKVPSGVWEAFGAMWAGIAILKFTGLLKVLGLMKEVLGKKFPNLPGFGGGKTPGAPGGPGTGPGEAPARPGSGRTYGNGKFTSPVEEPGVVGEAPGMGGANTAAIVASLLLPSILPKNAHIGPYPVFGGDQLPLPTSAVAPDPKKLKVAVDTANGEIRKLYSQGNLAGLKSLKDALDKAWEGAPAGAGAAAISEASTKAREAIDKLEAKHAELSQTIHDVGVDVAKRWAALASDSGASAQDMRRAVTKNTAEIKDRLGTDTYEGARALNGNFKDAVGWVRQHMSDAKGLTADGMKAIRTLLRQHLTDFGITGKAADRYMAGQDPLTGKPMNNAPGDPSTGHAHGGWIGSPGERGGDTVPVMLGRGEAVLNHYQQAAVNAALQLSGMAPGGLDDLFDATAHTRHYMAGGGFAGGRRGYASGGQIGVPGLEGLWEGAGGPKNLSWVMAQIALAESGGWPRRNYGELPPGTGPAGGDGGRTKAAGLWQILGLPIPGDVYDPRTNARMAVAKWRMQGLRAWQTDTAYEKYVPGHFATGPGGGGHYNPPAGSTAAQPGGGHARLLRMPNIRGGLLGGIVQGALSAYTRGANSILAAATPPAAAFGAPVGRNPGGSPGTSMFEGFPVANWIVKILKRAQSDGVPIQVSSGFRSYAEQVYLWNKLGRDPAIVARPGTSNHEGATWPKGAVDLTSGTLGGLVTWLARHPGSGLKHYSEPRDPYHFSATGHAAGRKGSVKVVRPSHPSKPQPPKTHGPVASINPPHGGAQPASWQSKVHQWLGHHALSTDLFNTVPFAEGAADTLGGADVSYKALLAPPDTPPAAYSKIDDALQGLQGQYTLGNREYGRMPAMDARGRPNSARPIKLAALRVIQQKIAAKIREKAAMVLSIVAAYAEARRRLRLVRPYATAPVKTALNGVISGYTTTIAKWRGVYQGLTGQDIPNADMDIGDTDTAISDLAGPTDDLTGLTNTDQGTLDDINKDIALASLTPDDPSDDKTAYGRLVDFWTGVLDFRKTHDAPATAITDAATNLASARSAYKAAAAAPTLAAQALSAFAGFTQNRADLFANYGSNFSPSSVLNPFSNQTSQAAGMRYFGATGASDAQAGGASGFAITGGTHVAGDLVVQQQFPSVPEDPHLWSRQTAHELEVTFG